MNRWGRVTWLTDVYCLSLFALWSGHVEPYEMHGSWSKKISRILEEFKVSSLSKTPRMPK